MAKLWGGADDEGRPAVAAQGLLKKPRELGVTVGHVRPAIGQGLAEKVMERNREGRSFTSFLSRLGWRSGSDLTLMTIPREVSDWLIFLASSIWTPALTPVLPTLSLPARSTRTGSGEGKREGFSRYPRPLTCTVGSLTELPSLGAHGLGVDAGDDDLEDGVRARAAGVHLGRRDSAVLLPLLEHRQDLSARCDGDWARTSRHSEQRQNREPVSRPARHERPALEEARVKLDTTTMWFGAHSA